MAVPSEMLLNWEQTLVNQMATGLIGADDAVETIYELIEPVPDNDPDLTLAVAERLVILARKAVELRDQRREDEARAEWGSKDSDPRVP